MLFSVRNLSYNLNFIYWRQKSICIFLAKFPSFNKLASHYTVYRTPQAAHPRIEFPFIVKVMLVVSQANFMYEFSSKVQQSLRQFLSHGIKQLVRGVSEAKHCEFQVFQGVGGKILAQ